MSMKIQLNSSNNLAQLANNIHPGSDRHITNMARTHDTRPRAMEKIEIIYLLIMVLIKVTYITSTIVRDQAVLHLFGTNFPGVIWSKKHENLKSGIFSIILDSMALGYSGSDNSNI